MATETVAAVVLTASMIVLSSWEQPALSADPVSSKGARATPVVPDDAVWRDLERMAKGDPQQYKMVVATMQMFLGQLGFR